MRIEGWSLIGDFDPYQAPELQSVKLLGHVYGHPMHYDGKRVMTSSIVGEIDEDVITASGSRYVLGSADPEYEKMFPGARARLINSIRKQVERNGSPELS